MTEPAFVPPRFGTDGLRGRAGEPPMDALTLSRIGAALGEHLHQDGQRAEWVLLGHDGRTSADWIRDALVAGLAAAEVRAVDLGLLTTPALAYLTRHEHGCAAGIMISASHNPATDNGIKIFGTNGSKLPDAAEHAIEQGTLRQPMPGGTAPAAGCEFRPELIDDYRDFLLRSFDGLDLRGVTLVVDAANGGGSRLAPDVLRRLGATVVPVACAPDGTNINHGVGALHPESLRAAVRSEQALLGICLDGDGDRVILVDDHGEVRDGDEIMFALACHLDREGQLPQHTLVATVMSNLGLHRALARRGVSIHTTPVGDRSVVRAMRDHGLALGGEQSGHIVFAHDDHFAGDGLFTALHLLALPDLPEKGSAALFADFRRYPQTLVNVPVSHKPDLAELAAVQKAVREVEDRLAGDGRVVLRYSGTEDLCRVMIEGSDAALVEQHAETIAAAIRSTLA